MSGAGDISSRWKTLLAELGSMPGMTAHRRVYLESLIRFGEEFQLCGRDGAAEHLFRKARTALATSQSASSRSGSDSEKVVFSNTWVDFRSARLHRTLDAVIKKHGHRLDSERLASIVARLEVLLASTGVETGTEADAETRMLGLEGLLAEVHELLLVKTRAESVALRLRAARQLSQSQVATARVVGPYNDFHNLHGLLGRLVEADPVWVEEMKSLYKQAFLIQELFPELPAGPGKT